MKILVKKKGKIIKKEKMYYIININKNYKILKKVVLRALKYLTSVQI